MNNFRMRKFFARLLLPTLTVWMCWMPSQAYAFVPAAIGGYGLPTAAEIAAASGGAGAASVIGAVDILAGAGLISVGAAMSYFAIDYFISNQLQTIRIPLRDTTANAVPAPSAPSTASPTITDGSFTVVDIQSSPSCTAAAILQLDACNEFASCIFTLYGWGSPPPGYMANPQPVSSTCTIASFLGGGTMGFGTLSPPVSTCPIGYNVSGSSCVLANARVVTPDRACDLERSGSALAMISDPDCASSGEALPIICDGVNFWCGGRGVNAGQPVQYKVTPRASGGSGVQVQQQQIINGQSQVKTTNIEVNSAGVVESVSGQVQAGTIASPSGASASVDPVAPTIDTAASPQSPSGQSITFPSDYARTGEAATAADGIKTRLDTLHNDLSSTTNTTDPIEPTANDMPGWGNTFSGLLSWQLPAHSGTCPTPSLDLSSVLGVGKVYAFDAHCTLINNHFQALNAAMTVVWSMLALFIVLRA